MKLSTIWLLVTLSAAAGLLVGCAAEVKPWQRGNLARQQMALDPDPNLSKLRNHVFESKEASKGGQAGSGGGCGCN